MDCFLRSVEIESATEKAGVVGLPTPEMRDPSASLRAGFVTAPFTENSLISTL